MEIEIETDRQTDRQTDSGSITSEEGVDFKGVVIEIFEGGGRQLQSEENCTVQLLQIVVAALSASAS